MLGRPVPGCVLCRPCVCVRQCAAEAGAGMARCCSSPWQWREARAGFWLYSDALVGGASEGAQGFERVCIADHCHALTWGGAQMADKEQDDLYVRFKTLQRQLEFIEIQVCSAGKRRGS